MSRQAVVGVFSILSILGLFVIFWFLTNQGSKLGGYRMGVRFAAAAGLRPGSQVFLSGLSIGTVDAIQFAPDYTVDVILAIKGSVPIMSFLPGSAPAGGYDIPKDSSFRIQAPLTGDSAVVIVPPPPSRVGDQGPWPHRVLALDDQPKGSSVASFQDVLAQGGEMLNDLQKRLPAILDGLQSAVSNGNAMAIHGNQLTQQLSSKVDSLTGSLQGSLDRAGGNIVALTHDLRETVAGNRGRIDGLLAHLNATAVTFNDVVDSMKSLVGDQQLRGNLTQTTQNIAQASASLAQMAADAAKISGNGETQAQLRDTVANLNAVVQKANSLLGSLGGKSNVYGVDPGATPVPAIVPNGTNRTSQLAAPPAAGAPSISVGKVVKSLVGVQVRVSELNPAPVNGFASPILGTNQGPQSDFNLLILPKASMSLFTGANNLGAGPNGGQTTYNFALLQTMSKGLRAGGGVLYSRLGLMSQYSPSGDHGVGFSGALYDPQHPTLDMYGTLPVIDKVSIFGGERDIFHSGRRTVFGLQLNL